MSHDVLLAFRLFLRIFVWSKRLQMNVSGSLNPLLREFSEGIRTRNTTSLAGTERVKRENLWPYRIHNRRDLSFLHPQYPTPGISGLLSSFDHASFKTPPRGPALTVLVLVVWTHSMPSRTVGGDIEQERERKREGGQYPSGAGQTWSWSTPIRCHGLSLWLSDWLGLSRGWPPRSSKRRSNSWSGVTRSTRVSVCLSVSPASCTAGPNTEQAPWGSVVCWWFAAGSGRFFWRGQVESWELDLHVRSAARGHLRTKHWRGADDTLLLVRCKE